MNKLPATAIMQASITAEVNDLTSNPEKNLSVIFITMAETISRTKKDNKPSVRILSGSLRRKPMVAFKMPITNATAIAVP